jgi:hypothetical protein
MNYLAYPLIHQALRLNDINNHLLIESYDEQVRIHRIEEFVILRDREGFIYSYADSFKFLYNKPIYKVTILYDKYGALFREIFVRHYWKAALIIQRAWKRYRLY